MRAFKLSVSALLALAAATPALAADLPVKAPMMPVVVPYSWSGWYIGGNVGYSWGRSRTDVDYFTFPGGVFIPPTPGSVTSADFNLDGVIGGGQLGFNWQSGVWVFGLEADIQWSDQKGSSDYRCAATAIGGPCLPGLTFLPPAAGPAGAGGSTLSLNQKLEWFGTFRGRVGITPAPTWLIYATGGLAYGEIQTDGALASFTPNGTPVAALGSFSETRLGWTAGAGIEGVISGPWTGKIEYLYMDLGSVSGTIAAVGVPIQASFTSRITDNILRVGLNYRFMP